MPNYRPNSNPNKPDYTVRGQRWVSARPEALKQPPGASDYFVEKPDIRNPHKDYNVVAMSDFKVNPSLYMVWSKNIPLAVTRYGRIQSMVLSLAYYNQLLLKIRDVQAEVGKLRKLIHTLDPNLLKVADAMKNRYSLNPDRAVFPLLDQQPKRIYTEDLTRESLRDALDELKAYSDLFSNASKVANPDGAPDDFDTDDAQNVVIDGW